MSGTGTVPKFTSFKPKLPVENEGKEIPSRQKIENTSLHSRGRRHHHRDHRSSSRDKSSGKEPERSPLRGISENETSDPYIVDKQGDVNNLVYGSIHRYSVPPFHRIGAGSVLGALKWLKIDRDSTDEKGIVLSSRKDELRSKREKYAFARNEKKAIRLLRIRSDADADNCAPGQPDFISLWNIASKKRKREAGYSDTDSGEGQDHYRSIEGKAKAKLIPTDDSFEYFTESDDDDPESGRTVRFNEAIRRKTIELSRNVDERPHDIETWLALINHQDTLLGLSDDGHRNITSAERRSTADIKLHLYEKALKKAGLTVAARERLLIGLMAEGSKIWDLKTQSERWEQVSQDNLESVLLWKQYLDFRQTMFTTFRYEEIKSTFMKRITLLKSAIGSGKRSEISMIGLLETLIYTVLRATLFMREAGYTEISIAIWQALLELNFYKPNQSATRLESFKDFWESEVPRIGEEGSIGWKNFNPSADASDPRADSETPAKYLEANDIFDGWATAEAFRESVSMKPARTLDDVMEDDPYRVILWSDIENFLVDISTSPKPVYLKELLLDAYLLYCRLPPCSAAELSRKWWSDPFVRGELLEWNRDYVSEQYRLDNVRGDIITLLDQTDTLPDGLKTYSVVQNSPFRPSSQLFVIDVETLFPSSHWAKVMHPWRTLYSSDCSPQPYKMVQNTLRDLVGVEPDDNFVQYYLAFQWCNEPESIKKIAKGLLKQRSRSLRLYNAYAMVEWSRGNGETATSVITAALGMKTSLPEEEQKFCIMLWRAWAWRLLDLGEKDRSIKCLFSIAEDQPDINKIDTSSPVSLLKTRQHLSSMRDHLLSTADYGLAICYGECLALVEYLMSRRGTSESQGDIIAALKIFSSYYEVLIARGQDNDSADLELSHQAAARLLYHHVRTGPFRPALVRDHLSQSLKLFPKNTIFITLYSWNEARLRIDDRVRTILRSTVLTEASDNIITRLFAISFEMSSGNVHSIRAAFENAVSSPACGSNPGLWRLYILFCAQTKKFRNQAKDILYRGMRACPWAKRLFMMAFTDLKWTMSFEDMRAVYRVISEKELRLHVDLEDRLEEWDERKLARRTAIP